MKNLLTSSVLLLLMAGLLSAKDPIIVEVPEGANCNTQEPYQNCQSGMQCVGFGRTWKLACTTGKLCHSTEFSYTGRCPGVPCKYDGQCSSYRCDSGVCSGEEKTCSTGGKDICDNFECDIVEWLCRHTCMDNLCSGDAH